MAELYHYGVPKDQWSDEARRRYDARHRGGGKTIPWDVVIRNLKKGYDAYQDTQRSTQEPRRWSNKVDEHRFQTAEARRRNRRGAGYYTQSKPDDGQHTTSYRKPNKTETKSRLPNKPHSLPETTGGRTARIAERAYEIVSDRYHNGKNSSRNMRSGKNASNRMRVKSPNESANGSAREYNYLSRRADRIDSHLRNGGRMSDYFHNGSVVKQNRYHNNSLYFIPEGPGEDAIRNKQGKRRRR